MSQIAYTMPEAKFRSVKKRVKPVTSIRTSEFAQEVKSLKAATRRNPAEATASAASEPETKTAKKKAATKVTAFWPVAVGLFLSGVAPEWHAMASQAGLWVMRLTFPFALLATHREIGIDSQMAAVLPGFAIFAQLPIDGLMIAIALQSGKGLKTAVAQMLSVHAVCAFVLWLLTFLGK